MEFLFSVTLCDLDGEVLHLVHVGREPGHRSAARSSNTDQHGVTSLLPEDSRNSRKMLDAVSEEDEVHWGIVDVVDLKALIEPWDECVDLCELDVLFFAALVVTEQDLVEVFEFPLHVKVVLHLLVSQLAVPVAISLVDKTISEHSESLVDPQMNQASLVLKVLEADHEDSLDHLGEISEVEGVMALGWSWQEVVDGLLIEVDRGLDDWLGDDIKTRGLILSQETLQDSGEDSPHACL